MKLNAKVCAIVSVMLIACSPMLSFAAAPTCKSSQRFDLTQDERRIVSANPGYLCPDESVTVKVPNHGNFGGLTISFQTQNDMSKTLYAEISVSGDIVGNLKDLAINNPMVSITMRNSRDETLYLKGAGSFNSGQTTQITIKNTNNVPVNIVPLFGRNK